ncbi:non-repetitive nucleoporin [Penicillium argentinense]|uniref:Non-repetitive nucleoporin n=1 Tax=Penicillium argentinense TaxID=1131581 RepID=A0A9W9F7I9_9EURO|nr:non-repetitive nucleoporin [Penicillium argentinense]KAJ5095060.1 non-repetitive nucleoporin [Penicillium argentinense]
MAYPTLPTNLPPGTPQRPLPGAFLQTPAVPRNDAPRSPPQPLPVQTPLPNMAPAIVQTSNRALSVEERGAHTINNTLAQEARFPDLDSYLSQGFSSDYDIPTSPSWAPFQKVKMYNIPDQIFDQYNRAQVSTSMGLFAEINHAWVAIDNALYLWDFKANNPELVGFEEQPNSINAVKLVKPRPGVFLPNISHLLVVATTAEVIILAMSCEMDNERFKVSLFETKMAVPVRGLDIHVIAASDQTGRIFFGGSTDNHVWELTYQQEERWFYNRCAKVNHTRSRLAAFKPSMSMPNLALAQRAGVEHVEQMVIDDSRRLLYTLSNESTIRVLHFKNDGSVSVAITKRAVDIYANIGHTIASHETLNPKVKIVSISPVPEAEAKRYHLVATTATGYRVYLSATGSYSWDPQQVGADAPTSMQAQHIKTPPVDIALDARDVNGNRIQSLAARGPLQSLSPTRLAARFPPGYFFCFTCRDPTQREDTLFISAPDSGRLARPHESSTAAQAPESAIWLNLGGKAEDIGLCSAPLPATAGGFGNEMAVQFDQPAAQVAILTNTGIHIIRRRRPVDIFASLARSGSLSHDGLDEVLKAFSLGFGRAETLATALAVACGQGEEIAHDQRMTQISDPDVLEFARKIFVGFGGKPTPNQDISDGTALTIDDVTPSPRHQGIALYISRLLRSIWKKEVSTIGKASDGGMTVAASVATAKLQSIQQSLSSLQEFFKVNRSFIEGLSGPDALARAESKAAVIELQAEHRAVHSLVQLVSHTIEGISFVLVLFDERVDEIVNTLPDESKHRFLKLTFEELFSTSKGHEIAKELVKGIVNRNIAKGSNVETIADALRRRCGSFCSPEDVVIFKAQELLKRASEAGANSDLGRNLLNESLKLFLEVAENLPMDYLVSAVDTYINTQFFAGAIQLCLNVAGVSDKANLALSWIMDGRPEQVPMPSHAHGESPPLITLQDSRKEHFYFRKQCYDLVSKVIVAVDNLTASDPGFIDGQPTQIAKRQNEAYCVISGSQDEVFLTSLYDWYLEQGWSDRLLQTQSPFVVTYLERKSADDIAHADLLWRYYAQSQRFFEAAKVQFQLAQSAFTLPLSKRIEYLGRARANASTFTPDVGRQSRQRLLQEIGNLIDVANIQDDLLHRLKEDKRIAPERKGEVLQDVDGPVMDISTLFNQYADSASYYDICLQIFYLADYRNAADIKATWQHLIQDLHEETLARGTPKPYEAVIEKLRSLGSRLRMSDTVFPVRELLPILERYNLEHQRTEGTTYWVVDLFLELGVAYESLYAVLEAMYYTDEAPFQGANRRYIAADLVYLLQGWFHESAQLGGMVFGSEAAAERVSETLLLLQQNPQNAPEVREAGDRLRAQISSLLR